MHGSGKIILLLSLTCVGLTFLLYKNLPNRSGGQCPDRYPYISRDLNCAEDPTKQTELLKESISSQIQNEIKNGKVQKVSVFYRDLSNRQWFGVNENENFSPGSLLKLPLAMAYYKYSEIDPGVMNQQYLYKSSDTSKILYDAQNVKPLVELESGKAYSIQELIDHMIQYSDNEAVEILSRSIDGAFFNKVYLDLGVYFPKSGGIEQDFISVKTYGGILRALYNASYLNQASSNSLLETMTKTTFRSGLAAGVPVRVKVANKFGERIVVDLTTNQEVYSELHDCGIIYARSHPYVLCIMTRGKEYEKLSQVIAEISKKVYENR